MAKKSKQADQDLIVRVRDRFKIMRDADEDNRRDALDDYEFINVPDGINNGTSTGQWDENMKKERGKRPCYVFNKLRITMKRIINDIRAQKPSGKVSPVEGGDKPTAEILEGLIRNICNMSDFDTILDGASDYQVNAGYGAWRLDTEYAPNSFYQDIKIRLIQNPFCLFCDPSDKSSDKKDAADWILTEQISKEAFKAKYPKAEPVNFEENEFDDNDDWEDEEEVRIAEYWYKESVEKEIWLLQDGKVVDSETDEAQAIEASNPEMIKDRRTVEADKIMMCIVSGDSILEQPTEWAGTMFPFVVIYGEYMVVDGRVYWYGAGRWGKDPQRSYNVARTAVTETIAQAPQAKWWATTKQAEGMEQLWAEAHKKNYPWLLYNPDPSSPGPPGRMGTSDIPVALIQEAQMASEEINMVTGRYQNDVGAPNSASSGKQELVRNQQGAIATYNYPDNVSKGVGRTWELLIDLIPKVFDTERELRVLGSDGAEDYKTVNTFAPDPETGEPIKINDLSAGRYDFTITTGPSFATQRQEAAEIYQQLVQGNPAIFPIIGDLIFKSMDLPYSEDIAERLKVMLPPEIQQTLNDGTKDIPPEVQAMMQQAQQAMQMVEQQMQEVQQAAQEADLSKSESEKLLADLATKKAQFDAYIAQKLAGIAEKDSRLTIQKVNDDSEGVIEATRQQAGAEAQEFNTAVAEVLSEKVGSSIADIQNLVIDFHKHAEETMKHICSEKDSKPKIVRVDAVRKDGKLSAIPVYDDSTSDSTKVHESEERW